MYKWIFSVFFFVHSHFKNKKSVQLKKCVSEFYIHARLFHSSVFFSIEDKYVCVWAMSSALVWYICINEWFQIAWAIENNILTNRSVCNYRKKIYMYMPQSIYIILFSVNTTTKNTQKFSENAYELLHYCCYYPNWNKNKLLRFKGSKPGLTTSEFTSLAWFYI